MYRKKMVFYSTEKHKTQKMYFEINLYFMKLKVFFNELYAVG